MMYLCNYISCTAGVISPYHPLQVPFNLIYLTDHNCYHCFPVPRHCLTLRGLSLFFKILPISNTGVSAAYILATVHFLYPKLGSFFEMEYYFYQFAYRDSKVLKRFVGLIQMQCFPSFDCNWGKQNNPTACWHQLHPHCICDISALRVKSKY